MMKLRNKLIIKKSLVIINVLCLLNVSTFANSNSAFLNKKVIKEKFVANAIVKELTKEIEVNGSFYYPDKYNSVIDSVMPEETKRAHDELIAKFKNSQNDITELKDELISKLNAEAQIQLKEMSYVLSRMDSSSLDRLFDRSMQRGRYSKEVSFDYNLSFTAKEKRGVIYSMIASDIEQMKSAQTKRISLSTREQLIKEFELAKSFFVLKNQKLKRTAAIILTVIAAGLATWALTSFIKTKFEKKTRDMNNDFDNAETETEEEFAKKTQDLIAEFEERERLREEGYVWMVCGERKFSQTSSCIFDHTVHSGEKVCVTRCLKNPATGDEKFAVENCSSAFIPNNCHIKNQYDTGWDNGYDDGYDDGYDRAYDSAYEDAYADFYYRNYDRGYNNGYDYGYSAGYSDGYDEAVYDNSIGDDDDDWSDWDDGTESVVNKSNTRSVKGFKRGYADGYRHAQKLKLGLM